MSSDEDWSDSDSELENEQRGEVSTSVLLGLPDGPLTSAYDDADPTVSRAGGLPVRPFPVFLYRNSAQCNVAFPSFE